MSREAQRSPRTESEVHAAAAGDDSTVWYLIRHSLRHLWLKRGTCGFSYINDVNSLRRAGWQETADTPRRYRCRECSEAAS